MPPRKLCINQKMSAKELLHKAFLRLLSRHLTVIALYPATGNQQLRSDWRCIHDGADGSWRVISDLCRGSLRGSNTLIDA